MKSLKLPLSHNNSKNDNRIGSWLKQFFKGFALLLTYELIEELIEEAIAQTITTVIATAVSFIAVIICTQISKAFAKSIARALGILLKPIVKKLTYKVGNDKIIKIKRFIDMCKEKIKNNKFLQFLKRNPKSIVGVLAGVVASLAGGALTTGGLYVGGVELPLWAKIVIGCVVFAVLALLTILGVTGAGFESKIKLALREVATRLGLGEAVVALEKVEQEFIAEQEKQAELEKKAEEERLAKYSIAWRTAIANGSFDGSLQEYIDEMAKKEEEARHLEEERVAKEKAIKIKNEWRTAVLKGEFTGSLVEWEKK